MIALVNFPPVGQMKDGFAGCLLRGIFITHALVTSRLQDIVAGRVGGNAILLMLEFSSFSSSSFLSR